MEHSYLPLFRKYRPQSFKDIVGQENLVKALSNAIELNRIANAYLFCGPRGTGKTSSARILAKSLNCEHGPTLEPCQKCASCVDITNAAGLDVIEIDAASNRGIQDAKELIAQAQYAPINGKYKIFIIDEVHMLSNDAFNALLKTFEEPPENVIFILATTEPHKVLETIVSRCQRFDLRRITTEDIVKRLREISDLENIKITDAALYTIAKNVSGGLRDSLALLDQVSILGVREEIDKELIEELLGKINFDVMLNLLKDINDENVEKALLDIDNIYSKGSEPRNLAENFMEFLRNIILILNSNSDENIISFTNMVKGDIEKVRSLGFDKNKVMKILNTMVEYYKEIKVSTNPYLWMELAGIASCRLDLAQTAASAPLYLQNTNAIQAAPAPRPAPKADIEPASKPAAPMEPKIQERTPEPAKTVEIQPEAAPKPAISPTNSVQANNPAGAAKIWTDVVNAIQSVPAKAFYTGVARLVKIENNTITIGFLHENSLAQAKTPSKFNQLKAALEGLYPNFSVDMIKIDANSQYIDFKPQIQRQAPKAPNIPAQPSNSANPIAQSATPPEAQAQREEAPFDTDEEGRSENHQYSEKVQEMIEQYSGRIIE